MASIRFKYCLLAAILTVWMVGDASAGFDNYDMSFIDKQQDHSGGHDPPAPPPKPAPVAPVVKDRTAPVITSIEREGDGAVTLGDGQALVFNVTFSESVRNIDLSDFVLVVDNSTHHRLDADTTAVNMTKHHEDGLAIPDEGTVVDVLHVNATGGAVSGTVSLDMRHQITSQLGVSLTTPDCSTIQAVANGTAVFMWQMRGPHQLDGLADTDISGPWAITITDHKRYFEGTVWSWTLTFTIERQATLAKVDRHTWQVSVMPSTPGHYALALADDHDIEDHAGNNLKDPGSTGADADYLVAAQAKSKTC